MWAYSAEEYLKVGSALWIVDEGATHLAPRILFAEELQLVADGQHNVSFAEGVDGNCLMSGGGLMGGRLAEGAP